MIKNFRSYAIITFLALPLFAGGQGSFGFKRLGVNEGLSQNSVTSIIQDKQGFIWIATGDGLNRYDGKTFRVYRFSLNDSSGRSLPGRAISGNIVEDGNENLWFVTERQLVCMNKRTERFKVVGSLPLDYESEVSAIEDERFLIIKNQRSFYVFDMVLNKADAIYISADFYLRHKNGITFIVRFDNKVLTYKFREKKLNIFATGLLINECLPSVEKDIWLLKDSKYIYTYNFLTGKLKRSSRFRKAADNQSAWMRLLTQLPNGDIYLSGNGTGIYKIKLEDQSSTQLVHDPENTGSLSGNYIRCLFLDATQNLWVGTEGAGINILNLKPPLFKSYPPHEKASTEGSLLMVKSIYAEDDSIYIGTFADGIHILNRQTQKGRKLSASFFNKRDDAKAVFVIKRDNSNRLWVNVGNRIGYVGRGHLNFINYVDIPAHYNNSMGNALYSFTQMSDSIYILGSFYTTYLLRLEKTGSLKFIDLGKGFPQLRGYIQSISKNDRNEIMIGKNQEGYVRFKLTGDSSVVILEKGLTGLTIKNIYEDRFRKCYWICTDAGIIVKEISSGRQTVFDVKSGLSNNFIYGILPQGNYNFWVSTNKGLNKITLRRGTDLEVENIEHFTVTNGLQSNEFNTGAYFKDDRFFYFGGVTGINWFSAGQFINRHFDAPVYLTTAMVNDQPISSDSSINYMKSASLEYDKNDLLLQFAALDYTKPEGHRYAYLLEGYDKKWTYSNNLSEARYARLPHGRYSFFVKAASSDGVWTPAHKLLQIRIIPPFWVTWWFRGLAVAIILGSLFYLQKFIERQRIVKQLRRLEKEVAVNNERLRISKDMHDELGTGLSKIALLSEVGKHEMQNKNGNSRIISEISSTSRGLAEKMGEIIWTLNPRNDTLDNLAAYLKEYIADNTEHLPVAVHFSYPDDIAPVAITNLIRQQILLVTKEALNNALKYANAGQLKFSLEIRQNLVLFVFEDNGAGFNINKVIESRNGKKNGLNNMQSRINEINGLYNIESEKGKGTRIAYGVYV